MGYRLRGDTYQPIENGCSLKLAVDDGFISFYCRDSGEKLLIPNELAQALRKEALLRRQAEQRAT